MIQYLRRFDRVLLLILDSVGCGALPDAARYGDDGANTLGNVARAVGGLSLPHLGRLGLGNIISFEGLEFGMKPIEGSLRKLFFMLTFTSIGIVTDFRELAKEGLGRLAAAKATVYLLIVVPIGLFIGWLFHHGMIPPTAP